MTGSREILKEQGFWFYKYNDPTRETILISILSAHIRWRLKSSGLRSLSSRKKSFKGGTN
jgi:hypothetical protein